MRPRFTIFVASCSDPEPATALMAILELSPALHRFLPTLPRQMDLEGSCIAHVVDSLETRYPGSSDYIVSETGSLRPHVNIFVNDVLIRDRARLTDSVGPDDRILIIQALSGG